MHEGQQPRDLHENGTRSSSPQLRQQVRTKPSSKSPQPAQRAVLRDGGRDEGASLAVEHDVAAVGEPAAR
jgi:hypothetical protein